VLGYTPIADSSRKSIPCFVDTLRQVDAILLSVEQMLVASRSHSPFNNYLTQLSAEQAKTVTDGISELRAAMLCLTRREGVNAEAPTINTAWAVRQSLEAAGEKLAEVDPPHLTIGYDGPHRSDGDAPEKLLTQMREVLRRLDRALS
jgi:hypothetical protein